MQARPAAQMFRTLGELKGGAMKLGQAVSAMEPLLPAELADPYRDTLIRLQEAAPPMPITALQPVLAETLGADWRDRFERFEDQPCAAASIGQVHRATWHDGAAVAVKIQYPGVAAALAADTRQLDRLAPMAHLGAPVVDFRELFGQLHDRLLEELDYVHEAEVQRAFAEAFADDPDILVPTVVHARPKVLVTTWAEGTPLADVIAHGTSKQRDTAGVRLVRLLLSSPERAARIHGDPHPGNFRLQPDCRLVVLDFGSSEVMPTGWPAALGPLLRAARDRDAALLHAHGLSAKLFEPGAVEASALLDVLDPWMEPFRQEQFHFDRDWLQRKVRTWSNQRSTAARLQRKVRVPARHLLVQRVAFELLGVLTALDCTIPVRAEVERWIPDLA